MTNEEFLTLEREFLAIAGRIKAMGDLLVECGSNKGELADDTITNIGSSLFQDGRQLTEYFEEIRVEYRHHLTSD